MPGQPYVRPTIGGAFDLSPQFGLGYQPGLDRDPSFYDSPAFGSSPQTTTSSVAARRGGGPRGPRGSGDARQVVWIEASEVEDWINNMTRELPRAVSNRIKRTVVTEASDYYLAQLQARTPEFDTGNLRKSMTRVIRQYARRGRRGSRGANKYFLGVVGPDVVKGPHAHLVEYGTADRHTRKGLYRGRMPPRAFFEAIFASSLAGGLRVIETAMQREMDAQFGMIAQGKPVAT